MNQDVLVKEAVARAQNGDPAGFEMVIEQYFGRVRAIAYARLRDHEAADDLAQEVFLLAWLHIGTLRDVSALPAWLGRITRNQACHWIRTKLRRSRVLPLVPLEEVEMHIPDPQHLGPREEMIRREDQGRLHEAILALPEELREVVLLHYGEGIAQADLAREMGVNPSTVCRQLKQAAKLLRHAMEEDLRRAAAPAAGAAGGRKRALAVVIAAAALSPEARSAIAAAAGEGIPAWGTLTAESSVSGTGAAAPTWAVGKVVMTVLAAAGCLALLVGGYVYAGRPELPEPAAGSGRISSQSTISNPANKRQSDKARQPRRENGASQKSPMKAREASPTLAFGLDKLAVEPALGPDTSGTLVRGRVRKPDGSPAAGAMISIMSWKYWSRPTAVAAADSSGTFELKLPPGSYTFYAKLGDLVKREEETLGVAANGTVSHEPEIWLVEGGTVRGSVVDTSTGKPVAGALVITDDGDFVRADGDGAFRIEGVRRGAHTITAVQKGFYYPRVNFDTTGRADTELVLETKPGATLRGVVTNQKGKPIAGATVRDQRSGPIYILGPQKVRTDEQGRYEIGGYDPEQEIWNVEVAATGYAEASKGDITFPSGQKELVVDFKLGRKSRTIKTEGAGEEVQKLRTISGRITDENGTPLSGALVAYGAATSLIGYSSARTDAEGRYRLEHVKPREDLLSVQKEGYAPAFATSGTSATAEIDFRLGPQHAVRGKVVDEEGKPIGGVSIMTMAEVELNGDRDQFRYLQERAKSAADGGFELDSLPPGKIFVDAYHSGYSDASDLELEVDRSDHVITLTAPGQISGTVVDAETSEPVTDFQVRIDFPRERQVGDFTAGFSAAYRSRGLKFHSPDGSFTVSELTANSILYAEISAPGYSLGGIDRIKVGTTRNIDPSANVFRLQRAGRLEGVVLGSKETTAPVAGARVTLMDFNGVDTGRGLPVSLDGLSETHRPISIETDVEGRFHFDPVPYTRRVLLLEKEGLAATAIDQPSTTEPLQVVLYPGASIRGTIGAQPGRKVGLSRTGFGYSRFASPDKEGRYRFSDVIPGTYRIWVAGNKSISNLAKDVEVVAGKEYFFDEAGYSSDVATSSTQAASADAGDP